MEEKVMAKANNENVNTVDEKETRLISIPVSFYDKAMPMNGKIYKTKDGDKKRISIDNSFTVISRDQYAYETKVELDFEGRAIEKRPLERDGSAYQIYADAIKDDKPLSRFMTIVNDEAKAHGKEKKTADPVSRLVLTPEGQMMLDDNHYDYNIFNQEFTVYDEIFGNDDRFSKQWIRRTTLIDILEKFTESNAEFKYYKSEDGNEIPNDDYWADGELERLKNLTEGNIELVYFPGAKSNSKGWTLYRFLLRIFNFRNKSNDSEKEIFKTMEYRRDYLKKVIEEINMLNGNNNLYRGAVYYLKKHDTEGNNNHAIFTINQFCEMFGDILPGIIKSNIEKINATKQEEVINKNEDEDCCPF